MEIGEERVSSRTWAGGEGRDEGHEHEDGELLHVDNLGIQSQVKDNQLHQATVNSICCVKPNVEMRQCLLTRLFCPSVFDLVVILKHPTVFPALPSAPFPYRVFIKAPTVSDSRQGISPPYRAAKAQPTNFPTVLMPRTRRKRRNPVVLDRLET